LGSPPFSFTFERKHEQFDAETALDGIYVLRTSALSSHGGVSQA